VNQGGRGRLGASLAGRRTVQNPGDSPLLLDGRNRTRYCRHRISNREVLHRRSANERLEHCAKRWLVHIVEDKRRINLRSIETENPYKVRRASQFSRSFPNKRHLSAVPARGHEEVTLGHGCGTSFGRLETARRQSIPPNTPGGLYIAISHYSCVDLRSALLGPPESRPRELDYVPECGRPHSIASRSLSPCWIPTTILARSARISLGCRYSTSSWTTSLKRLRLRS
jgi:hypothetical protein